MNRFSSTERVGVNAVENIILKEIQWIFREQPIIDMGIDAHIESVDNGIPTGKLIGVQIKTGESHFSIKNDKLVYYGKNAHLEYWLSHSLPVIIVGFIPSEGVAYWAHVNKANIQKTKKNWKISLPKSQILNSFSKVQFEKILEGSDEDKKYKSLLFNKGLMKAINNGNRLIVTLEEWINKSLGRSPINIIVIDDNGEETTERKWNITYVGYTIEDIISYYFPWADVSIDYDFYDIYDDENSDPYCVSNNPTEGIYPYQVISGEIAQYRLELHLNEIGKSFLTVLDYIEN